MKIATQTSVALTHVAKLIENIPSALWFFTDEQP